MSPEQRYRLEQAKQNTPSTNSFILWVPLFVFLAWFGRNEMPEIAENGQRQIATTHTSHFEKYANQDPVCGGDSLCFLGWKL